MKNMNKVVAALTAISMVGCATVPTGASSPMFVRSAEREALVSQVKKDVDAKWQHGDYDSRYAYERDFTLRATQATCCIAEVSSEYLRFREHEGERIDKNEITIDQAETEAQAQLDVIRHNAVAAAQAVPAPSQQDNGGAVAAAAGLGAFLGILLGVAAAAKPQPATVIIVPARRCNIFGCW